DQAYSLRLLPQRHQVGDREGHRQGLPQALARAPVRSLSAAFCIQIGLIKSFPCSPDKNPDDKKIADRFARLGLIASILRDAEKRKRYDFFYENGVPKWRDYYSRYRPGLGAVVGGLVVFSCFVQYIFLYLTARVQKFRITAFRNQALEAAWGPSKKPQTGKKKLKVKTGDQGDALGLPGVNNGKPLGPGSTIEMAIEGDKVWIIENKKAEPDGTRQLQKPSSLRTTPSSPRSRTPGSPKQSSRVSPPLPRRTRRRRALRNPRPASPRPPLRHRGTTRQAARTRRAAEKAASGRSRGPEGALSARGRLAGGGGRLSRGR
ncbi:SPOSA6832_00526, partial [Sporobolomyces salmonicolor]